MKQTTELLNKIKNVLKDKQLTKEAAYIMATTGESCTIEEQTEKFIKQVNSEILNNVKNSQFMCLVKVPEILNPLAIKTPFQERGFTIHTLVPEISNVFIISWK